MASFYGNMKNNSRASFIFDKIYPTRTAMEAALQEKDDTGAFIGDGIFINRYVLVDYHYLLGDNEEYIPSNGIDNYYIPVSGVVSQQNFRIYYEKIEDEYHNKIYKHPDTFDSSKQYYEKKIFIDRFNQDDTDYQGEIQDTTGVLSETAPYYQHRHTDWENYKASYDCTVWMKIYANNQERYIMVAELDAKAPIFEFRNDAPSCYDGNGHFDARASTDLNYVYFIPNNWDIVVNQYTPNLTYNDDNSDDYWYYQTEKTSNPIWFEDYILTTDTVAQKNKNYYNITFSKVSNLTVGSSIKNLHYYNKINNKYVATEDLTVQPENLNNYWKITAIVEQIKNINENVTGLYEPNIQKKTFNDQVEYPYYNKAGFNKKVSTHVSENGQGVFLKPVKSTKQYPTHKFVHAGVLTADTYLPQRYYTYRGTKVKVIGTVYNKDYAYYIGPATQSANATYELISLILNENGNYIPAKQLSDGQAYYRDEDLINKNYFIKSTKWARNTAYYEITTIVDSNNQLVYDHEDDTYRLDIYMPELGNTVASIYDVIYGSPVVKTDKAIVNTQTGEHYNNLIGWCTIAQWNEFISDSHQPQNDNYWAGNRTFGLTDEEFNNLSPERYPGIYDVPVYLKDGSNVRPYNDERIKSQLAPPYDNIDEDEDISVGWAIAMLKRYLSELRYLAYGKNNNASTDTENMEVGTGIGLQSDWTLEDDAGFGYIYHKPNIITCFVETQDTIIQPNRDNTGTKDYYRELINDGEVVYQKLNFSINDVGKTFANSSLHPTYTVFELPRSYVNNIESNKPLYIRCVPSDSYNPQENYYIQDEGGRWVPAFYSIPNETVRPIEALNNVDGYVQYNSGYQVVVDSNSNDPEQNIITQRVYSYCDVETSSNSVTLYYNNLINGEYVGKAVNSFSIIITNEATPFQDAALIPDIDLLVNSMSRADVLTYLNTTLVINYGTTYRIDSIRNNWPTVTDETETQGFYYVALEVQYTNLPLTAEEFAANPTRYFTREFVPIVQADYEIHNIWNSVLVNVLQEP